MSSKRRRVNPDHYALVYSPEAYDAAAFNPPEDHASFVGPVFSEPDARLDGRRTNPLASFVGPVLSGAAAGAAGAAVSSALAARRANPCGSRRTNGKSSKSAPFAPGDRVTYTAAFVRARPDLAGRVGVVQGVERAPRGSVTGQPVVTILWPEGAVSQIEARAVELARRSNPYLALIGNPPDDMDGCACGRCSECREARASRSETSGDRGGFASFLKREGLARSTGGASCLRCGRRADYKVSGSSHLALCAGCADDAYRSGGDWRASFNPPCACGGNGGACACATNPPWPVGESTVPGAYQVQNLTQSLIPGDGYSTGTAPAYQPFEGPPLPVGRNPYHKDSPKALAVDLMTRLCEGAPADHVESLLASYCGRDKKLAAKVRKELEALKKRAWAVAHRGVERLKGRAANPGARKTRKAGLAEAKRLPGFDAADEAFRKFHGGLEPSNVKIVRVDDGKKKTTRKVVVGLGVVPETHYVTPFEGSNKQGYYWVHEHPEGKEPLEVLDPETGVTLKIGGSFKVTDWWHD